MMGEESVSVLGRINLILETLQTHGRMTVGELARLSDIPKATVYRIVADLVELRYVERAEDGSVDLGLRLFEFGVRVSRPNRLRAAALPELSALRKTTKEHVILYVNEGDEMVAIAALPGRLGYVPIPVGGHLTAVTSACGKAFLPFAQDQSIVSRMAGRMDSRFRSWWERDLESVRETSVAVDMRMTYPDIIGVASPVFSPSGTPVATLSAAMPANAEGDLDGIVEAVRAAAASVSRSLAVSGSRMRKAS